VRWNATTSSSPNGLADEGANSLLILAGKGLSRANLQTGELRVATEAGVKTLAIRCARLWTVPSRSQRAHGHPRRGTHHVRRAPMTCSRYAEPKARLRGGIRLAAPGPR
jgi:hypothetical protein